MSELIVTFRPSSRQPTVPNGVLAAPSPVLTQHHRNQLRMLSAYGDLWLDNADADILETSGDIHQIDWSPTTTLCTLTRTP